jgi:hypothetical protein
MRTIGSFPQFYRVNRGYLALLIFFPHIPSDLIIANGLITAPSSDWGINIEWF